jgi:tetratricopeptide (TPR) repeat protein
VAKPLVPLLSTMPGVSQCISGGSPVFDMHCPTCSLPLAFGTRLDSIPSATSYLPAPPEDRRRVWEDRLGLHDRLRVGLVWSGNAKHSNDRNRSLPLQTLSRILDLDACFVSLQKDPRDSDQAFLREHPAIVDLTEHLTDFAETAALVSCLDLVITVDTSVAHLAGALGAPTWVLLPYAPDFRWLLDRDDSPWYPTARLFRQDATRDYARVVARVRGELLAQIAAFAAPERRRDSAAAALHDVGLRHMKAGQHDQAVECFTHAIQREPQTGYKADYLASLGEALQRQERYDEALQVFDKAVQLEPDDAALWTKLGGVLGELKRDDDAVLSFEHALTLDPRHWEAAYRCGMVLHSLGRFEESLAHFNICNDLQPDRAATLYMRALALRDLKQFPEALDDNMRAHALDPANAEICNNIGSVLHGLGRDEDALPWFDRALVRRPDFVVTLNSKALSLSELHRFDEAMATYRRVLALDPNNAIAEWNLGLLQMLTGDFAAGWKGREARWRALPMVFPDFPQPVWLGDGDISGKTILIGADEGIGDAIQFARYLPMLAERGARVVLIMAEPVCSLLSRMPGVALCVPKSVKELPAFDIHCPMSSLPLAFGTRLDNIPTQVAYLPAPAADRIAAWESRLGHHDRLRVGLVWSGNPVHKNDRNRSLPFRMLTHLLDVDATFVSLQKELRPEDAAALRERTDIVDLTAELTDFSETAALVSCLDLIITVDTSVAHLAAASGRPTWILLPYTPDYRWLLDRDDSPWYPTVRLFRQEATRDYASVIDRMRTALLAQASAFKTGKT